MIPESKRLQDELEVAEFKHLNEVDEKVKEQIAFSIDILKKLITAQKDRT